MIRQIYTGKIENIGKVNPYIYDLTVKVDQPFLFKAGQFVSFFVTEKEARAYSIASSPKLSIEQGQIRLIVGPHPGGASEGFYLNAKKGDSVSFRGPFGIFTLDKTLPNFSEISPSYPTNQLVFIATSTGIAPFLSMIEYLADVNYKNKVKLYFGLRYTEDIMLQAEFEELKKKLDFEYVYCFSQPENGFVETNVMKQGYVTDYVLKYQASEDFYFLCGSTKVVSGISSSLRENNFRNVFFENYG